MKRIILVAFLALLGLACNAQTVLTSIQRDSLFNDTAFRREVKWAILNKASYWKGLDGTSLPGGVNATTLARWAKSRAFAAAVINSPAIADSDDNVRKFLVYIKTIPVWSGTKAATVSYMITNSTFDTLADTWFDSMIATSYF